MKKVLQVLGIVFVVILVVAGGIMGYAAYTGTRLDASSKAYVDTAVPAIVAHWSQQALVARAAPQLLQAVSPAQLTKAFSWFRSLGPMKKWVIVKTSG